MKGTKKDFLENYTNYPELAKKVLRQMSASWAELYKYPKNYRDASAGVNGFINYCETEPFARRNLELIIRVQSDYEEETGCHLSGNQHFKSNFFNFMAWFALETIVDEVMRYKEDKEEV